MKRSRTIRLALLGSASALALAACDDPKDPLAENKNFFTDPAECTRSYDSATCSTAFQQAQEEHRTTAPAFGSKEACEEKFGVGNCGWQQGQPSATQAQAQPQGSSFGGGGFFMPLMMGYMLGNMMGGSSMMGAGGVNCATNPAAPGCARTGGSTSSSTSSRSGFSSSPVYRDTSNTVYSGTRTLGTTNVSAAPVSRSGFGSTSRSYSSSSSS